MIIPIPMRVFPGIALNEPQEGGRLSVPLLLEFRVPSCADTGMHFMVARQSRIWVG